MSSYIIAGSSDSKDTADVKINKLIKSVNI